MFIFQVGAQLTKKDTAITLDTIPRPTQKMKQDKLETQKALDAVQTYYNQKLEEEMKHVKQVLNSLTSWKVRVPEKEKDHVFRKIESSLKTKNPAAAKSLQEAISTGTVGGRYDPQIGGLPAPVSKSGDFYILEVAVPASTASWMVKFKPVATEKGIEISSVTQKKQ